MESKIKLEDFEMSMKVHKDDIRDDLQRAVVQIQSEAYQAIN
jgi:hypothetical protein